jgi:hypothetical protein
MVNEELKDWDAFVMAWLYGSEAAGNYGCTLWGCKLYR